MEGYGVYRDLGHPRSFGLARHPDILLRVTDAVEILIGNNGADHVSINISRQDPKGWYGAEIQVRCNGLAGNIKGSFLKGELSRFAEEIRHLHRDLSGTAPLQPLEPNITLTLMGDGKGHVAVRGIARNDFARNAVLTFEFTIDQTYLTGIADSLTAVDPA